MKPQHFKPRKAFMQQLQEKITAELKTGRIYQVTDSSACNLFIIGKIDKPEEARFLHDLKDRNDNIYPDKMSIPDIPSIINYIVRYSYYSKINITNTYYECYGTMVRDSDYTLGGRRGDGRTAGWRDGGRTAGRREDGGRRTTAPQLRWVQYWGLGDAERERMVLLVRCTRRCVKKEEGSGGRKHLYT